MTDTTIDTAEVAKFSAMAAEWWDPHGKFAPLHKFNPVRLQFIRDTAARHYGRTGLRPFTDLSLLDIGCGGGLLSEPMARLGFAASGAAVTYRATSAEVLAAEGAAFDVVLNMEVVEHVADLRAYLRACARLVKPGGLMFVATLNRTLKSLALAKIAAEYLLHWLPPGTHDWNRFVTPDALRRMLEECGLNPMKTQGMAFDPLAWDWRLSDDVAVNYMIVASR